MEQTEAQRIKELEDKVGRLEKENKTMGQNMRWLRGLVEEQVALTEQTSGLVVEHITSLDGRMNETGEIFAGRIKRTCEKLLGCEALRNLEALADNPPEQVAEHSNA